jgi:regulatory protein
MPFSRARKPTQPYDEPRLLEYAIKSLGARMKSEADLRRLMRSRVEADDAGAAKMDRVIARLKEYGYLNDTTYAENYTQLRQQNEKQGARRVKQDLSRKGISKEIITEVVEARYADLSEETLARQHLDRKRIQKPEDPRQTARVMRRLVTAGFSVGVIYKILRQWNVPDEALAALEGVSEDGLHEE